MTQFVKGQVAHITLDATDIAGTYVDPENLSLVVLPPDGTSVTVASTRDALGKFSADLPLDQVGVYQFRWQSSGANQSVGENSFLVHAQQFTA